MRHDSAAPTFLEPRVSTNGTSRCTAAWWACVIGSAGKIISGDVIVNACFAHSSERSRQVEGKHGTCAVEAQVWSPSLIGNQLKKWIPQLEMRSVHWWKNALAIAAKRPFWGMHYWLGFNWTRIIDQTGVSSPKIVNWGTALSKAFE